MNRYRTARTVNRLGCHFSSDTQLRLFSITVYNIVEIITILTFTESPYNFRRESDGVIFVIDYSPLWETMRQKQVTQYHLLQNGIDNKTLDSLKKGKNITLLTLEKLCNIVGCTPNDVIRFKHADET